MDKKALKHLLVDIGNTNIVLGVFTGDTLQHRWRLNTRKDITVDEVGLILKGLTVSDPPNAPAVDGIAVACVVPSIQFQWIKALGRFYSLTPQTVEPPKCTSFRIDSNTPEQFGGDRLCNILACQALGYTEAIIIDFGTATTFDVYSQQTYWGGVICPGVLASMGSAAKLASRLSEVELYWNKNVVGKNTDDAFRNGLLFGVVGQIEYFIKQILREIRMENPVVIGTGGLAGLIGKRSPDISIIEEDMTLIGLNYFMKISK
jgi:type III pantothenate kinase